jgi:hypoxanthine phosphoribosyltransferase
MFNAVARPIGNSLTVLGTEIMTMTDLPETVRPYFTKVLVPSDVIVARCADMGREIREYFGENTITILSVLKGAYAFSCDLVPHLDSPHMVFPYELEFCRVQSYVNDKRGDATITGLDLQSLRGKHVLILDDLMDTGATLQLLHDKITEVGVADLKTAVFALKRLEEYKATLRPDFVGVSVPNEWIAGYGMDYNEMFRNIKCIGVMSDLGKSRFAK